MASSPRSSSTDIQKRYVPEKDGYATTWAELTVSCEACHGPGSAHVAWAKARSAGALPAGAGTNGLVVRLERGEGAWTVTDPERGIAEWTGPPRSTAELDVCARCHARRRPIVEPYAYGQTFLDTHVPALLDPGLYHDAVDVGRRVAHHSAVVVADVQVPMSSPQITRMFGLFGWPRPRRRLRGAARRRLPPPAHSARSDVRSWSTPLG